MTAVFKRLLASFLSARELGDSLGFDVSVETLIGRFRVTPGHTNTGAYENGTVRVEGMDKLGSSDDLGSAGGSSHRRGFRLLGKVRAALERAEVRVVVIDGIIRQAMLGQSGADVFGADFVPRLDKVPAMYVDPTGRIFEIGLIPTDVSETPFVMSEGFWHRGAPLGRFQNRALGIGARGVFQRMLKVHVLEGRVDALDPNIQPDGRVTRGSFLIRPEPRIVLEFDSLRVFLHVTAGAVTLAQMFARNGKIAQADFANSLTQSTRLTFPEDA